MDLTTDYYSSFFCQSFFTTPVTAMQSERTIVATTTSQGSVRRYTSWTSPGTKDTTVIDEGSAAAGVITILWKPTDLAYFDSGYASMLASRLNIDFTPTPTQSFRAATASPVSSPTSVSPTDTQTMNDPSPSGLSTGAKAGLGVGIGLGVISAVILFRVGLIFLRRKHMKSTLYTEQNSAEADIPELIEVRGSHQQKGQGR